MTSQGPTDIPQSDMGPTSGHKERLPTTADIPAEDDEDGNLDSGSLNENQPNTKPTSEAPIPR